METAVRSAVTEWLRHHAPAVLCCAWEQDDSGDTRRGRWTSPALSVLAGTVQPDPCVCFMLGDGAGCAVLSDRRIRPSRLLAARWPVQPADFLTTGEVER